MTDNEKWILAEEIAYIALGKVPKKQRKEGFSDWVANRDPLARWCLMELIRTSIGWSSAVER